MSKVAAFGNDELTQSSSVVCQNRSGARNHKQQTGRYNRSYLSANIVAIYLT